MKYGCVNPYRLHARRNSAKNRILKLGDRGSSGCVGGGGSKSLTADSGRDMNLYGRTRGTEIQDYTNEGGGPGLVEGMFRL